MPTISEDPPEIHYGQNEETNFEQLMVNMLDERDKLMETLRETQDSLALTRAKLTECQKEKDGLMNHLESVLNDVRSSFACVLISILPWSEVWPFILWLTQIRHIWSVIECHFMERVFTYPEHTARTVQVRVYFQNFYKKPFLLGTALFKSKLSWRCSKFQSARRISRLYCWFSELHSSTQRSKIPATLYTEVLGSTVQMITRVCGSGTSNLPMSLCYFSPVFMHIYVFWCVHVLLCESLPWDSLLESHTCAERFMIFFPVEFLFISRVMTN